MERLLSNIGWDLVALLCLTLGLAPYAPPHIWEKLVMLWHGRLVRPLDWFDLFIHSIPWALLALKALYWLKGARPPAI